MQIRELNSWSFEPALRREIKLYSLSVQVSLFVFDGLILSQILYESLIARSANRLGFYCLVLVTSFLPVINPKNRKTRLYVYILLPGPHKTPDWLVKLTVSFPSRTSPGPFLHPSRKFTLSFVSLSTHAPLYFILFKSKVIHFHLRAAICICKIH